jgi:prepilin-type N-terminal cleavage/methylation domain-containing protein
MRAGGFTLIEVLVALVITGLALGCVLHSQVAAMAAAGRAQREEEACEIAQSALVMAVAGGAARAAERQSLAGGFVRVVSVRKRPELLLAAAPADLVPYQVDVSVTWNDAGRPRTLALSTMRLGAR